MEPNDNQPLSNSPEKPAPISGGTTQRKSRLSAIFGFILSIIIPPIGLIISIISLRVIRKQGRNGQKLAIAGIVIGSVLTLFAILVPVFILNFFSGINGGGHKNQAQVDLQPMLTQIQKLGGKEICSNGENGYSVDTNQPQYETYYTIPTTAHLTSNIESLALSQGYILNEDSSMKNYITSIGDYSPTSDYLVGQKSGASLSVIINRNTSVALTCDTGEYSRLQRTDGNAIIDISMTLPSV
jgi:hypothetical protein